MAARLGHTIIEPRGSLVPLVEKGHTCAAMQGLALKNVDVKLLDAKGKCVFEEFGELLYAFRPLWARDFICQLPHAAGKG